MDFVKGSRKLLMTNPKFRRAHIKLSGKFNRQRNRLRRKQAYLKVWSKN